MLSFNVVLVEVDNMVAVSLHRVLGLDPSLILLLHVLTAVIEWVAIPTGFTRGHTRLTITLATNTTQVFENQQQEMQMQKDKYY